MLKARRSASVLLLGLLFCGPLWGQSDPFLRELPKLQNLMYRQPDQFRVQMNDWRARAQSWPSGEAKAKLWLLLADDCRQRGDRPGEIGQLREALTLWKDRQFLTDLNLRLAFVLLRDNQIDASKGAIDQALAAMPADPPPMVLELLLQHQREEAQRRGDSGVEFSQLLIKDSLHGGKELRDSLALARWFRERNLPDGQLLWWSRSLERADKGTRMTPVDQWISLWEGAPTEKKEWAEQKLLSVASVLPPGERSRLLLSMTRSLSHQNLPLSRKLAFIQPLRETLGQNSDPELELEIEQQMVPTVADVEAMFGAAGFKRHGLVEVPEVFHETAEDAVARLKLRAITTFEYMTEAEIQEGFARLETHVAAGTFRLPPPQRSDILVLG